jgi:UDP-N-acetylglucosamine transferase subunit ALG13
VSWVFDGFRPVVAPEEQPDNGGLRIVVSLGTHDYEFRRLVDAVLAATRREDRVLVQHGATRLPAELPPGVEASPLVPTRRFAAELDEAHVVVAHAGTGIALSALEAGRRPVLVPRSSEHDEHVDDHQQLTAQRLGGLNLAAVVTPEELTRDTLLEAAAWRVEQVSDKRPLSLSA